MPAVSAVGIAEPSDRPPLRPRQGVAQGIEAAGPVVVGHAEIQGQEVASLPPSALLQSGDAPQVWVVGDDGKVHRRAVQLLRFDANSVVISRGLSAGERVVTAGINSLAEGESVKPETEVE